MSLCLLNNISLDLISWVQCTEDSREKIHPRVYLWNLNCCTCPPQNQIQILTWIWISKIMIANVLWPYLLFIYLFLYNLQMNPLRPARKEWLSFFPHQPGIFIGYLRISHNAPHRNYFPVFPGPPPQPLWLPPKQERTEKIKRKPSLICVTPILIGA